MICGLLVGRGGSVGFPKKNIYPLLNRPLMSYPLLAAKNSSYVDEVYVSSDSEEILNVGKDFENNLGCQCCTRFIQHQHLRIRHQPPADYQHLNFSAAQGS